MATSGRHIKSKDAKVKVNPFQERFHPQLHKNKSSFNSIINFSRSLRAVEGQTFSGNIPNNFKGTLETSQSTTEISKATIWG